MPVLVDSQNHAPRYRGQLNALLPSALPPRAIVHCAVHGTSWHSFDYSPNRHEITVYYTESSQAIKFAFILFCCKLDLVIAHLLISTTEKFSHPFIILMHLLL